MVLKARKVGRNGLCKTKGQENQKKEAGLTEIHVSEDTEAVNLKWLTEKNVRLMVTE